MNIKEKSEAQSGGRGGARLGAGRPSGSPNKSTVEQKARISEIARAYTDDALASLVKIAKFGKSESARVAAACALLDRAYGKPPVAPQEAEPAENSVARLIADLRDRGMMERMPLRKDLVPEDE